MELNPPVPLALLDAEIVLRLGFDREWRGYAARAMRRERVRADWSALPLR